jgi:hypothetical protein
MALNIKKLLTIVKPACGNPLKKKKNMSGHHPGDPIAPKSSQIRKLT